MDEGSRTIDVQGYVVEFPSVATDTVVINLLKSNPEVLGVADSRLRDGAVEIEFEVRHVLVGSPKSR